MLIMQPRKKKAHQQAKTVISERIGELETDKLAAQAGLAERTQVRRVSSRGREVRQGVDRAFVGSRRFGGGGLSFQECHGEHSKEEGGHR